MPSIPQSLLWISLVVLWLFVLVPMLVSKRDTVRRTSDVALATRVLNSGRNARLRRPRASAGHHSDPHWQPAAEYEAEYADDPDDEARRGVARGRADGARGRCRRDRREIAVPRRRRRRRGFRRPAAR